MRLMVLDRCTVTRGDISLDELKRFGELKIYDVIPENRLAETIRGADAVICNKARITSDVMAQCPHLKYVGLFATGYDNVDIREAARRGIVVCNAPGYSTDSVAQHTFSLLLNLASNTVAYNASVHSGDWMRSSVFTYLKYPITEISGKKLGIAGYGAIGRAVAALGRAFGMLPLIHTRTAPAACPYPVVSFDTLLAESDFITLHCPLNDQTRHLINAAAISKMKKTAYLINTSRGGVIEEEALAEALHAGRLAGAGIDVLAEEPMRHDHPYFSAPNCIITPHIAWASTEARRRLIKLVCENLDAFLRGSPVNNVARKELIE